MYDSPVQKLIMYGFPVVLKLREYSCPNCDDGDNEDRDDHNDGDGDVFVSCFYFCFMWIQKNPSTTCNIISPKKNNDSHTLFPTSKGSHLPFLSL